MKKRTSNFREIQIFSAVGSRWRCARKQDADHHRAESRLPRACYPLQIDRRGAIADRSINVKFAPIAAEKLAPIRATNPEFMPGQLSSAELTRIHRS
jgi:hypothetical protein